MPIKRLDFMTRAANLLLTACFVFFVAFPAVVLDDHHFSDTVLLANLGWRGINGFLPNIDFPHFYGGVTAWFMTLAFKLFGVDYRSINYAFLMLYGASVGCLLLLSFRRLSITASTCLVVFAAALILSLAPIEEGFVVWPRIAHSFVYNHVATVLVMALTVYAAREIIPARIEAASSVLAGFVVFLMILLKTTFAIFVPFLLLALLIQSRLRSSLFLMIGTALGVLVLDPNLIRVSGSLVVLLSSEAARNGASFAFIFDRLSTALMVQAVPASLMGILLVRPSLAGQRGSGVLFWTLVLCGIGYLGMLVSMGGSESVLMLLPMVLVASVLVIDRYSRMVPASVDERSGVLEKDVHWSEQVTVRGLSLALCYSYVVPAFVSAAVNYAEAYRFRQSALMAGTPAAHYVVKGAGIYREPDLARSLASTLEDIDNASRLDGYRLRDSQEYIMAFDGITLLKNVPGLQDFGVISDGSMFDFPSLLKTPPVLSHPVWLTQKSEYSEAEAPLGKDVHLVMITREVPHRGLLTEPLLRRMRNEFVACKHSEIWTLYARREIVERRRIACDERSESVLLQ